MKYYGRTCLLTQIVRFQRNVNNTPSVTYRNERNECVFGYSLGYCIPVYNVGGMVLFSVVVNSSILIFQQVIVDRMEGGYRLLCIYIHSMPVGMKWMHINWCSFAGVFLFWFHCFQYHAVLMSYFILIVSFQKYQKLNIWPKSDWLWLWWWPPLRKLLFQQFSVEAHTQSRCRAPPAFCHRSFNHRYYSFVTCSL